MTQEIEKKISEMLGMQDELNKRLFPDWKERDLPWHRAIWIECAEAMDHHGWKWWKHQEPNMPQLQIELVDIWHFILSWAIQDEKRVNDMALFSKNETTRVSLIEAIEGLARASLNDYFYSSAAYLLNAVIESGMTFDDLYRAYVGKYALNKFRWDNGYQDGSYRKILGDGREDNEHLSEAMEMYKESENLQADVYAELKRRYWIV